MSSWREAGFAPVALGRVAALRVVVHVFTICDLFFVVNDVIPHARTPDGLYRPLAIRQLLHLPTPEPVYAYALRAVVIAACVLVVLLSLPSPFGGRGGVPAGRGHRWATAGAGLVAAAAFTDWVSIGMSYGKIDHDHFALVVALWVLPSVGPARIGDRLRTEAAGWAIRTVQVAAVCIYFLSAFAKVRFGGWDWVTGYTFAWAMTRRGTELGRLMLDPPWLLQAGQWLLFGLELLTPLLLVLRRWALYAFVALLLGFHLTTYLMMKIHFLPLIVCLLAFLPLERLTPPRPLRERFAPQRATTG